MADGIAGETQVMVITHLFADGLSELNSSWWRGKISIEALRRAGHTVYSPHIDQWFKDTPELHRIVNGSDLIVIQRVMVEESLERIRFWKARGRAICTDMDDSYGLLSDEKESGNQASKFWHDGKVEIGYGGGIKYEKVLSKHPLDQFATGCSMINGLTMPSKILMEDWQWAAPCYYIPNFIDSPRYLPSRQKSLPHNPANMVIGWGGSLSHINSFKKSGVAEALSRVFRQRKNVLFMLCGDKRIIDLLPIPRDRIIYRPYVMAQDWPKVLCDFDIGLAPLFGRYDHSRSAIKSEEYSIMGIPFVATGCPTYHEWQDRGVGLYVNDGAETGPDRKRREDEWEAHLLSLLDNYAEHKDNIDSQFEIAMEYDIDRNVPYIVKTYDEIIHNGR